jgi:hypothetical protein
VETVNGVEIRAIQDIHVGMQLAFRSQAMQDADDDFEPLAGPGEIAEVSDGPNADGDWSVAFSASGCWVHVEPEFIQKEAVEVVTDVPLA